MNSKRRLTALGMGMMALGTRVAPGADLTTTTQQQTQPTSSTQEAQLDAAYGHLDPATFGAEWNRRVDLFRADNLKREPGGIVMVGDSITDYLDTKAAFPGLNVVNRGISGDTIVGLITRSRSFLDLKPSRLFVLIGINIIATNPNLPIEEYERQYRYLFGQIKKELPKTKVYIQSVMPVIPREEWQDPMPRVRRVNALLQKLAVEYGFKFINLDTALANEQGEMKAEYTDDHIHPHPAGNAAWAHFLLPYMKGEKD
jgi:lysophospholipase L1-like esterase